MWPLMPSSLYGRFLRRELAANQRVFVIIWDSSRFGWGAIIRWWDNYDGELVVSTWDSTESEDAQVHREAKGGVRALQAASRLVDLRGSVGIFRNDAVGALAAFRKGCTSSVALQDSATHFSLLCADLGLEPLFLHAPGSDLVLEGVDHASRGLASQIAGPACSHILRHKVFSLADRLGWRVTIDAFASFTNRLVDRYFSEYAEPDSEAVDALAVTDWHCSSCPSCGLVHRDTLHIFAPSRLLRGILAKAAADGVRAIIIVPFSITAFYWRILLEAALPVNDKGDLFEPIRNIRDMLVEPALYKGSTLALFAVDFARFLARPLNASLAPGCGQEHKFRGRPLQGHPRDAQDRQRIRELLERNHQSLLAHGVIEPASLPTY